MRLQWTIESVSVQLHRVKDSDYTYKLTLRHEGLALHVKLATLHGNAWPTFLYSYLSTCCHREYSPGAENAEHLLCKGCGNPWGQSDSALHWHNLSDHRPRLTEEEYFTRCFAECLEADSSFDVLDPLSLSIRLAPFAVALQKIEKAVGRGDLGILPHAAADRRRSARDLQACLDELSDRCEIVKNSVV